MLIPKKNRKLVFQYIFKNGVMTAKKDFQAPKHSELDVPNLHVIKLMQSLKSREYVKENFAWRHYYYTLTNEGVEYLRDYLHLSPDVVPDTLKKTKPTGAQERGYGGRDARREGGFGGRREGGFGGRRDFDKKGGPGSDFKPEYRGGSGGFGRGGGAPRGGQ